MVKLSVSLVKPKFLLANSKNVSDLELYILDELKSIENIQQLKLSPDLLLYVARIIEAWLYKYKKTKSDEKISKKEIFIKVLKKLIPSISAQDEIAILQILEFLHSSGQIRAVSYFKWIRATLSNNALKKG